MKKVLEDAKTFALSEMPILIYGQAGIEDYLIAEAIHNNSNRKAGPYVSINMRGMDKEHQMEELFRREPVESQRDMAGKGAMIKADHGTLFIKGMEHLTSGYSTRFSGPCYPGHRCGQMRSRLIL